MKLSVGGVGKLTGGIDLVDSYDYAWSWDWSKQDCSLFAGIVPGATVLTPVSSGLHITTDGAGLDNLGIIGLAATGSEHLLTDGSHSHPNYTGSGAAADKIPGSVLNDDYKYFTVVITPLNYSHWASGAFEDVTMGLYFKAEDGSVILHNICSHINGKRIAYPSVGSQAQARSIDPNYVAGETHRGDGAGGGNNCLSRSEVQAENLLCMTYDLSRNSGWAAFSNMDQIYLWLKYALENALCEFICHGMLISSKPPNVRTLPIRTTPGGESR